MQDIVCIYCTLGLKNKYQNTFTRLELKYPKHFPVFSLIFSVPACKTVRVLYGKVRWDCLVEVIRKINLNQKLATFLFYSLWFWYFYKIFFFSLNKWKKQRFIFFYRNQKLIKYCRFFFLLFRYIYHFYIV